MRGFTVIFLLVSLLGNAQSDVVNEISALIDPNTIDLARERVNEYLDEDPENVDALVMKGNVIFYTYNYTTPAITMYGSDNDDIYDSSMGGIGSIPRSLPEVVADSITDLWWQAVNIDTTRTDIYLGIAHVLSISIQTAELIEHLAVLKNNVPPEMLGPYDYANYGRNMIDRNEFNEGIKVYQALAELYPEEPGLISDIAGEYYGNGQIDKALDYIRMTIQHEDLDDLSYGNAFYLFSIAEDTESALDAVRMMCDKVGTNEDVFYEAVVRMQEGADDWQNLMRRYLAGKTADPTDPDAPIFFSVGELTATELLKDDPDYELLYDVDLHDGYKLLINRYFYSRDSSFMPIFRYAEILTYHGRYNEAVAAFQQIDADELDLAAYDEYNFYFAWALHKDMQTQLANERWELVLRSPEFYYQSAAAWFLGDFHAKSGDIDMALTYWAQVKDQAADSKYAAMSWNAFEHFKNK